jgi:hypothetical protein
VLGEQLSFVLEALGMLCSGQFVGVIDGHTLGYTVVSVQLVAGESCIVHVFGYTVDTIGHLENEKGGGQVVEPMGHEQLGCGANVEVATDAVQSLVTVMDAVNLEHVGADECEKTLVAVGAVDVNVDIDVVVSNSYNKDRKEKSC